MCLHDPSIIKVDDLYYVFGTHIEAAKLRLDSTLSEYLAAGNVPDEAIQYAVDLLTWTTEQLSPDHFVDSSSIAVFNNVLKLSSQYDDDYFEEYLAILVIG